MTALLSIFHFFLSFLILSLTLPDSWANVDVFGHNDYFTEFSRQSSRSFPVFVRRDGGRGMVALIGTFHYLSFESRLERSPTATASASLYGANVHLYNIYIVLSIGNLLISGSAKNVLCIPGNEQTGVVLLLLCTDWPSDDVARLSSQLCVCVGTTDSVPCRSQSWTVRQVPVCALRTPCHGRGQSWTVRQACL